VISILKATAEHLYTTQPENERDNMVKSTLQRLDQVNDLCSYVTKKPSIFAAALHRLSKFLDRVVRQEWQGPRPANGLIDTENPRDFVRLYSALQFIFCCSAGKEADDIDIALFGDGFSWGGCILLYLLGHWHRFNFMDFTYWVLKLNTVDPAPTAAIDIKTLKKGQKLTPDQEMIPTLIAFLQDAHYVRQLNEHIFSVLQAFVPLNDNSADYAHGGSGLRPPAFSRPLPS